MRATATAAAILVPLLWSSGCGRDRAAPSAAPPGPQAGAPPVEGLAARVSFEFVDKPADECCKELTKLTGIPISIAPDLEWPHAPITLKVTDMEAWPAIDWVSKLIECRVVIDPDDGSVQLVPEDAPPVERRDYDVSDLLEPGESRDEGARRIAKLVAARIFPSEWCPATVEMIIGTGVVDGKLTVTHYESTHRLIRSFLGGLRRRTRGGR